MTIKIQSKSQYAFAIFLAGSVCGLTHNMQANDDKTPADQVETAGHRLQITGATQQILAAIDNSVEVLNGADYPAGTVIVGGTSYTANTNDLTSISLAIAAIQGASFATGTDSLKILSDGLTTITTNQGTQGLGALATSVQAVDIQGTNFTSALASLMVNAQRVVANQVVTIANSAALNSSTLTWTGSGTWAAVYTAITAAISAGTTQAEITAITDAITDLGLVNAPTTGYTVFQINNIVLQLQAAVTSWDALIS